MRSSARDFFVEAANIYFEDRLEVERDSISRNAILSEVRAASDWRKQLGMALLTAIVAPLILGSIIAAALFYSSYLTPAEVAERLHPTASELPSSAASPTRPTR